MNTVDYTPVPSLESLQKRVTALEAREVDLVERLRVAENLLMSAEMVITALLEADPLTDEALALSWIKAYQRTKESGHG
jgi:hypothetical protein